MTVTAYDIQHFKTKLNTRQRLVLLNQLKGMNNRDAYLAVYQCDETTAGRQSTILNTKNPVFMAELKRLLQKKEDDVLASIMQPTEVKQRLSELARARLADFLDDTGKPHVDRKHPSAAGLKEVSHRDTLDGQGRVVGHSSSFKMVDPVAPLQELAKIHGLYAPQKQQVETKTQIEVTIKPWRRFGYTEPKALGEGEVPPDAIAPPVPADKGEGITANTEPEVLTDPDGISGEEL